ncbi:MAG: hypothetical protein ACOH1Q_07685 [Thiobacillus sp.]
MKVLFAGQVPKDLSFPDANEDAFVLAADVDRVAVSDGASESFDSKTWARLLTSRFVQHPELDASWLTDAVSDYLVQFDPAQMSWSKQAAFVRGSFATLLGIEHFIEHGTVDVLGVGDSLAVLLDGGEFVDSFPYVHSEEFQQRPELFCTNATLNTLFSVPDFFPRHHKTWCITDKSAPLVLCMTDALGEWALRRAEEGESVWQMLVEIENVSELESLVLQERLSRSMRIDDTTLVRLSFQE